MQEYFRGKIIQRFMTSEEFKDFCEQYNKHKAMNLYRKFLPGSILLETEEKTTFFK